MALKHRLGPFIHRLGELKKNVALCVILCYDGGTMKKRALSSLFILLSLSFHPLVSAQGVHCEYAGSFDSIRLKVDYDPIFGDSELFLQGMFQSEGGKDLRFWDSRPFLNTRVDVADDQLGELVPIENKELFPFHKGSGKIKVDALVNERDFGIPRLWNYPMIQNKLLESEELQWTASKNDQYEESTVVRISNEKIDLNLLIYRNCY